MLILVSLFKQALIFGTEFGWAMYMLLLFGYFFLLWILEKIGLCIQEAAGHFWFAWQAWNMVKLIDFGSIAEHGVSARMRGPGQFLTMSLRKWAEA